MRPNLILIAVLVAALGGCGGSNDVDEVTPPQENRLVDPEVTPFVNSLEVDPEAGKFLLTTNRGFFSIDQKTAKVTQIKGKISAQGKSDTVGTFLEIEPGENGKLLGSGHPDNQNTLPQFLGFITSDDGGKTWQSISRMGDADLHKILLAHGKIYAFDAVLTAILISSDGGRTFTERFTPAGEIVLDFAVDPEDPKYLVATTDDRIYRSEDEGNRWRPVMKATGARLIWPEPGRLLRADRDGVVYESTDKGVTYKEIGKVPGEAYKFDTTDDPQHLYLALADGSIVETTDGGKTWKAVFKP